MSFAENQGIQIHYKIEGDGPLLTILGGLGDNIRNWSALVPMLKRHFRVLLIDNRGAGQSDRPEGPYKISDFAGDTLAVWQKENISKTHLLGFSMGGKIALEIAAKHPEHINKLVLIAATAAAEKGEHPFQDKVQKVLNSFSNQPEHFRQTFELLFSKRYRERFSPEQFAKFKSNDPHPQRPEDFASQLAAVREFDITAQVARINTPVLLIHGQDDVMTSYKNSEWLHKHLSNSQLKIYPDTGHIPQAEETKQFITDIIEFLIPLK